MYKTDKIVKQHLREFSPYEIPLREEIFFENIKDGRPFGYVQRDIEAPGSL